MANAAERVLQRMMSAVSRVGAVTPTTDPADASLLRKVLVVRTDDRVGDVLLTTPLLRALREGLPHARVDWLLADRRRVLVDGLFLAHTLIPFNRRWPVRNPARMAALVWRLKAERYDAVVDAAHAESFSTTGAALTRWTGAPVRIGHSRGDAANYYTHLVDVPPGPRYDVASKLALLRPLRLPERGVDLETSAGMQPEAVSRAAEILAARAGPGATVLVNPGSRKLDRRFDPARYGEVLRTLAQRTPVHALVVWGPGEQDVASAVAEAAGPCARLAPPTDLHVLAALLRRGALLLSNDTGPMHLGVACGIPVAAVFTAEDSARWGHPIPTFRAVEAAGDAAGAVGRAVEAALELLRGEG